MLEEHQTNSGMIVAKKKFKPPQALIKTTLSDPLEELLAMGSSDSDSSFSKADREIMGEQINISFENDVLDVEALIEEVVESNALVPKDLKVDDSACPQAPNYYTFVTDDQYLGADPPYLEQALIGIKVFGEYCVAKGSYIYTDGGMLRIEDAVGNPTTKGMPKQNFKTVGLSGIRDVTNGGMTSKRRKCLKVTYKNGKSIIVTPEHQVLSLTDRLTFKWVEAKDLKIGSFGISKIGQNLFAGKPYEFDFVQPDVKTYAHFSGKDVDSYIGKEVKFPTVMTPELARLIGYIITDGGFHRNKGKINGIVFTSLDDSKLAFDFAYCVEVVFGRKPIVKTGLWKENSKQPYSSVALYSRPVVEFFKHIGLAGHCYDKTIPDCILQSTKEHVVECLRSMMDCDGYTDHRIGITLSSPETVKQLSLLMDNLGLHGRYKRYVHEYEGREKEDPRNLRGEWICRAPRSLYLEILGTKNEMRIEGLHRESSEKTFTSSGSTYCTPGQLPYGKELYAHASTLRDSYHDQGLSRSRYGRRKQYIAKHALTDPKFVDFWQRKDPKVLSRIKKLSTSDLTFSPIVSIEDAGIHEVYDISVPEGENFSCDGMIVHNCPRCSDLEWMETGNHMPQEGLAGIDKHVVHLEFGVCPQCDSRRSEMIKLEELNFYNEYALNAGQRCVTGDTKVTLADGSVMNMKTIYDRNVKRLGEKSTHIVRSKNSGYAKNLEVMSYNSVTYTLEPKQITKVFRTESEPLIKVTLVNPERSITGRHVHPILTQRGWTHLDAIETSDLVAYVNDFGNVQYTKIERIESVKPQETYDITVEDNHSFIGNGIVNHNSGKSVVVTLCSAYVTHRILKMQDPTGVFGVAKSTILHGTFVALTQGQAKETLWDPYYNLLLDSPWFCLAEGTEISMSDGTTKRIEDMSIGDEVKTFEGNNTVTNVFDNGYQACKEIILESGKTLKGTDKHKVRCVSSDGKSLVWKKIGDLTLDDLVVEEDI